MKNKEDLNKEKPLVNINEEYQKRNSLVAQTPTFLIKSISRFCSMKNVTFKQDKFINQNVNTVSEFIQNNISTNPKSECSINLIDKNTFGDKFANDIQKLQETTNDLIEELKANNLKLSLQCNYRQRLSSKNKSSSSHQMKILKLVPITFTEKEDHNVIDKSKPNEKEQIENLSNAKEKEKNKDKEKESIINKNKNMSFKEEEEKVVKVNTFERIRKLHSSQTEIMRKSQKVYFIPIKLVQAKGSFQDFELQVSAISDQLKLIFSNNQKLKSEYLYTSNFMKAFNNLRQNEKTKYNILLEDTITIMISVVPKILKKLYYSLDQIIYCKLPEPLEEEKKVINSEDECLILNVKLFNEVSTYFSACIEIFEAIKTKKTILSFKQNEYFIIKVYLDFLRFNANNLITTAKTFIDKYYNDKQLISNFEVGCELKPKKRLINYYDIFDRIFQGERASLKTNSNAKVREIKAVLDKGKTRFQASSSTKTIDKQPYYLNYYNSLLNKPLINVLMKYYNKETREKIIANRIIERYRHNELNELLSANK